MKKTISRVVLGLPVMAVCALLLCAPSAGAAEMQGKAVVTAIKGTAIFTDGKADWRPLRTGEVLYSGAVVKTSSASHVDLFLGKNAASLRVLPNSTLRLERLTFEESASGIVSLTLLDMQSGEMLGQVKKLGEGSRHEIKTRAGVASVKGTEYHITSSGNLDVISGSFTVKVIYVAANGSLAERLIVVNAGQSLIIPTVLNESTVAALEPVPTPTAVSGPIIDDLAKLFASTNVNVREVVDRDGKTIIVIEPKNVLQDFIPTGDRPSPRPEGGKFGELDTGDIIFLPRFVSP